MNSIADAKSLGIFDEKNRSLASLDMKDSTNAIKAVVNCARETARVAKETPATPEATPQNETVDAQLRETILRHELSHGEFFTNDAYRHYCEQFWHTNLSERERLLFRNFLSQAGYDPSDETLMINETQAYLMHTPDPRAFSAKRLGATSEELDDLRRRFAAGHPPTLLLNAAGEHGS